MSDPRHDASIPFSPQPAAGQANEVGAMLRGARERAGLDVPALAALLKVPRGRIDALEAGRFEDLPDGVYARSLASSICRALRIEAQPVLALLPQAAPRSLDSVAEHKATRIKSSVAAGRGKFSASARTQSHVSRRALALVAVLVLAAAAVLLTPPGAFDKILASVPAWKARSGEAGTVGRSGGKVVEEVSLPSAAGDTVHPADSAPDDAAAALVPATPSSVAGTTQTAPAGNVPAGAPPAAASTAATASAPAVSAVPAAGTDSGSGGLLVISASAPTWIKVSDAKGAVLVQKTLGAGQVESVREGAGPLSVTVGRVDAATVQVRGEAFDLASRARNNVARFEVK
ncbi:MAG: DUF4115 domain-containing protein [Xylophilus ampelinus]